MLPRGLVLCRRPVVLCRRSVAFSFSKSAFCQSSTQFLPVVALWIHSFSLTLRSLYLSAVLLSEGDLRNSLGIIHNASSVQANLVFLPKRRKTKNMFLSLIHVA